MHRRAYTKAVPVRHHQFAGQLRRGPLPHADLLMVIGCWFAAKIVVFADLVSAPAGYTAV
jgi:hypothetical protein